MVASQSNPPPSCLRCSPRGPIVADILPTGGAVISRFVPLALLLGTCLLSARAEVRILVDHVGYDVAAPMQALVEGSAEDAGAMPAGTLFTVRDASTGRVVLTGPLVAAKPVAHWTGRAFWTADFSALHEPGNYVVAVHTQGGEAASCTFAVEPNLLERSTLSNVIFYFKGQRSSGAIDAADRHLKLPDAPGFADLHGGWYDATGDYGIHLSHQNPTSFFNPQQVPLVAWTLLAGYQALEARHDDNFQEYERRMLDEGLYGADFLARMQRPGGSFFETIEAPGTAKLPADRAIGNPNWRTQIKTQASDSSTHVGVMVGTHPYEASYRAGGGLAIAALALASTLPLDGELSREVYLKKAEAAFAFLEAHNRELLNDGTENILDEYCALLAATELYRATQRAAYRAAADRRAAQLMARLTTHEAYADYWRADDGVRPFFHPADAGMPVISLVQYAAIAGPEQQARVREVVRRSMGFELRTTAEGSNPFGYARQLVRRQDGTLRTAFFFPHDSEAAPWWQGEDARLGSLASAARLAAPLFAGDRRFQDELERYAWNQLHWILGRNPFDSSMLVGSGHGNAPYMFFRSYKYTSAPGAIVNGVTSAMDDEDGIAFNEGFAATGKDDDWRWTEEWLPHAAWYLYAVSLPHGGASVAPAPR